MISLAFWSTWGGFGRGRRIAARGLREHHDRHPLVNRNDEPQGDQIMLLGLAGTGYGLIGILVIILLVVMIVYFMRRA